MSVAVLLSSADGLEARSCLPTPALELVLAGGDKHTFLC